MLGYEGNFNLLCCFTVPVPKVPKFESSIVLLTHEADLVVYSAAPGKEIQTVIGRGNLDFRLSFSWTVMGWNQGDKWGGEGRSSGVNRKRDWEMKTNLCVSSRCHLWDTASQQTLSPVVWRGAVQLERVSRWGCGAVTGPCWDPVMQLLNKCFFVILCPWG